MDFDTSLIEEAERRGYIRFNKDRTRITYLCGRTYEDNYTDPEESVRAWVYAWLIIEKGYPSSRIEIERTVPRRKPGDRADIVVFTDDARTDPYLVVETKVEGIAKRKREWQRAIEEGFGYANSLRVTRYLLIDCEADSVLYDIQNFPPTERQKNRLGNRDSLSPNYGIARQFRLIAGGSLDIRSVEPKDLETRVRRAHAEIWAGGKRDPFTAFDEWSKLLFAKIWDERHTPNGEPRRFQVAANETDSQVANRVRNLFSEARRGDPSIFTDEHIHLPDDKIAEVARIIDDTGFTLCGIDTLGVAFEHFFSSAFRGDLGQYFTRRELCRFVCGMISTTDKDFILDPTVGSGGFLLEALIQTWHDIDDNYRGQPDAERRKIDFALNHLYGIEIHATLSRVCKTNLVIHKDGHTNIEAERSCLDRTFSLPHLRADSSVFTVVVGNPPFGDEIKEGDRDRLGNGSLADFELSRNYEQISSELVIIERALQFLVPGGRLGMVIPDGALNNSGEGSRCPAFRRYLLRNTKIDAIISLPDYAFRKAGAQNKTSLIFLRKFTPREQRAFEGAYRDFIQQQEVEGSLGVEKEKEAIRYALQQNHYSVFLAEVEEIGYNPAGAITSRNQLYTVSKDGRLNSRDYDTVLGQYQIYLRDAEKYKGQTNPSCHAIDIVSILDSHSSFRLDPKFHLFEQERTKKIPPHMREWRLGDLLVRRVEQVDPSQFPDDEFLTLTLRQNGTLSPREPGKGNNPPTWHGTYFTKGSRWYRAYAGDVVISQIDLWKGCVAVIPPEFDRAIVTQEFPLYSVNTAELDPHYLALLLRSYYFMKAVRAITTGHSNRRRTQESDFENLRIFLPDKTTQLAIVEMVERFRRQSREIGNELDKTMAKVEQVILGKTDPKELFKK